VQILRRYQPDEGRQLEALILLLRSGQSDERGTKETVDGMSAPRSRLGSWLRPSAQTKKEIRKRSPGGSAEVMGEDGTHAS
jgi:hypothetical protein